MKGVITADIIGSTRISESKRYLLPKLLFSLSDDMHNICSVKIEMFRGDSFQILVDDASKAPLIAILIRAGLRKSTILERQQVLDARMAIGIGAISYNDDKLTMSDGQAFVYSGREFDELRKRRLSIKTPDNDKNAELLFSTAFADDIISHWTRPQSECIYLALLSKQTQEQVAEQLKTTRQNVAKKLTAAKINLIRLYLDRASYLITNL